MADGSMNKQGDLAEILRTLAGKIEHGEVLIDNFDVESELVEEFPEGGFRKRRLTGRKFLRVSFWTKASAVGVQSNGSEI